MKTFFERINAWFLSLLLIVCGIFIFLLLDISQSYPDIVVLPVKIAAIIFSLIIFIFFWLWLLYQSRQEKLKLLKIIPIGVVLILILIVLDNIGKRPINERSSQKSAQSNWRYELMQQENNSKEYDKAKKELAKDVVKIGKIIYHDSVKMGKEEDIFLRNPLSNNPLYSTPYFSIEIENVSDKYRIDNITINLMAYKDNVAFYKGKTELKPFLEQVGKGRHSLNPKGKTTLNFSIDVNPKTFPSKPWIFATSVESVTGTLF